MGDGSSAEAGGEAALLAGGGLAKGFGPGAVAMTVLDFAVEADRAGTGDFLTEGAKVGAKVWIGHDAQFSVLEIVAEGEGKLFFKGRGEGEAFGLPTEALPGALVQLD